MEGVLQARRRIFKFKQHAPCPRGLLPRPLPNGSHACVKYLLHLLDVVRNQILKKFFFSLARKIEKKVSLTIRTYIHPSLPPSLSQTHTYFKQGLLKEERNL